MAPPLSNSATLSRRDFAIVGIVGAVVGILLGLLLYALAPALAPLALLSRNYLGTNLVTLVFLLVLGFVAMAEWPLMLFAMIRLARQAAPAWVQLGTHAAYALFPAIYGAIGLILTGQVWWLWVMLLVIPFRLISSLYGIRPTELATHEAKKRQAATTPFASTAVELPRVDESALAPGNFKVPVAPVVTPAHNHTDFQRPNVRPLLDIRGYVLDMDGVLYRGDSVRAGSVAFINHLNRLNIPYVCLTNNASRTSDQYAEKLARLGIPIQGDAVIGAAQATAEWLSARAAVGARVLVVGEDGLRRELTRRGFTLVEKAPADYVVVGIDFHMSYDKLKEAALALQNRAAFIGTNPDLTYPSEEGIVPGNGAQLAYLQAATGKTPTLVGKPEKAMMEVALSHLGLPAADVAMVGDRLDTDILGGKNVGMTTIMVRGGVSNDSDVAASTIKPDYVYDDLAALLEAVD